MLSTIREKVQGLLATIIVIIIAIPFALWGIDSYLKSDGKLVVAQVDDIEIGADTYRNALERQRRTMQQFLGKNFDPGMLENPAFKREVLNRLIDEALVTRYAEETGYRLSDAQLAQLIQGIPEFQRDGQFDQGQYESLVRNAGFTVAGFEQRMRQDAMTDQVRSGYAQGITTSSDIDELARLLGQKREVAYALISPQRFAGKVTVPEDMVQSYYAGNPDRFKTAPRVRVAFLGLSLDDVAKSIAVGTEEVRALYDAEVGPEERRASHILIPVDQGATQDEVERARAQAQDLYTKTKAGADFAALAREFSQDPGSAAKGGDLGYARRGMFVPEFEQALYKLNPGEVSEPVQTPYGFHVIRLTDVKREARKPFAQVRAELESQLRRQKAEERFYELSQTFQNLVYEHPDTLEPAAQALGLRVMKTDWFSSDGGAGIAAQPKVVQAAFDPELRAQQRNSDVIEIDATTFVALRVLDHEEAKVRPLEEVRKDITAMIRQELSLAEANRLGAALLEELRQGTNLATAAKKHGVRYVEPKMVSRQNPAGVPNPVIEAAFKQARPDGKPVYGSVELGRDGHAVYALRRVQDVDQTADKGVRDQARQVLERRMADYYDAYVQGLRQSTPIKVYDDRL